MPSFPYGQKPYHTRELSHLLLDTADGEITMSWKDKATGQVVHCKFGGIIAPIDAKAVIEGGAARIVLTMEGASDGSLYSEVKYDPPIGIAGVW